MKLEREEELSSEYYTLVDSLSRSSHDASIPRSHSCLGPLPFSTVTKDLTSVLLYYI